MKKIILILMMAASTQAIDWLWVRFYSHEPNPGNIPTNWPAAVREIKGETNQPPNGDGWTLLSVSNFNAIKIERKSDYTAWESSMENPRRRDDLIDDVKREAADRIEDAGMTDEKRARLSELSLQAVEAGGSSNLSEDLQAELITLREIGNKVAAIRAHEKALINSVAGKTNINPKVGWPE